MVERLWEEFGVEATLVRGSGGVFTVAVEGEVVARKGPAGFPTDDEIVHEVARRLPPG